MYISLSTAVISDIVIAATLCVTLSKSRTGFKKSVTLSQNDTEVNHVLLRTDTIVNLLMMYAVNSSKFVVQAI